ncbi:hypothetical protein GQ42DRAFT_162948 [Ramicandelaber brevisporus]|nr:hypothetical protein GQ42DRAFT_162948 [Ramicandelaber brevisporus]
MPNDLYEQFDFMQKKLKRHTLGLSTIEVTALLETITGIRIPQNQETDKKKDGGGNDNDDANAKATVIAKRLAHQRCLVTKEGPLEETLKAATKLAITTAQKQKSKLGQLKSQNQKKGGKHTANGDNAKEVPSPSIFLFTHNANAAAEWFRQVKTAVASPKMIVAKLFARHMNVEKQAEELAMHGANLFAVVGTPGRILRLIENGSMSANRANLVIFDCIKDTKDRTVFDEPAVARDLVSCMKVLFNTPAEETAKTIWTRPKLLLF